jgi:hypothetical protein
MPPLPVDLGRGEGTGLVMALPGWCSLWEHGAVLQVFGNGAGFVWYICAVKRAEKTQVLERALKHTVEPGFVAMHEA